MRRNGFWSVIFRGNYFRNIIHMVKQLYYIGKITVRIVWRIVRYLLRIILYIVGINYFELEKYIERKLRILFT